MTERCWLTSPTIHSHYHLFTVPDSRQTKQKATLGGAKKSSLLYKLRHKAKHNQTMTFSQHPPSRWRSPPAPHREINTRPAHMITQSQQSQTKEDDGHAHRRKVEEWHTAGTDVRAKNSTDVWKVWIKIQIVMEGGGGPKSSFSKEMRLQWFSRYDKRKREDLEDRVKEIDPSLRTDTLHISIIQRETDRACLVWQEWSSLVCSGALTATWRGWMDWPAIPTETHAAGEIIHLSGS